MPSDENLPTASGSNQSAYSEPRFWQKLTQQALRAGREVIEKALWLYYAAERPETPARAKSVIYGALAYFILPIDALPDFLPLAGYTDDLGVLAVAVFTISRYIDDTCKEKARLTMQKWFQANNELE